MQRWMQEYPTDDTEVWRDRVARPLSDEHERLRKDGKGPDAIQAKLIEFLQKKMPHAVPTYVAGIGALLG